MVWFTYSLSFETRSNYRDKGCWDNITQFQQLLVWSDFAQNKYWPERKMCKKITRLITWLGLKMEIYLSIFKSSITFASSNFHCWHFFLTKTHCTPHNFLSFVHWIVHLHSHFKWTALGFFSKWTKTHIVMLSSVWLFVLHEVSMSFYTCPN